MKDIAIIGAGGVGKEVAWIIDQINMIAPTWNIIGFIDDNQNNWNKKVNGYTVIGGIDCLENIAGDIEVVIAIANYKVKKSIVKDLNGRFNFASIVHPDVYLSPSIEIGHGSIIYPGVIMTSNITIGNHVIISPKCGIGHDSVIGDYVSLLWNVNISGFDIIEEGVLVGSGATIIQGKRIEKGAIIGAGAVVVRDVERNSTNVGVPTIRIS